MPVPGELWIAPAGNKPDRRVIVLGEEQDGTVLVVHGTTAAPWDVGRLPHERGWTLLMHYRPLDGSGLMLSADTFFYIEAVTEMDPGTLKAPMCHMDGIAAVDLVMAYLEYIWVRSGRVVSLVDARRRGR
jgi:hypothetical protein